jgi:hypothetical protein
MEGMAAEMGRATREREGSAAAFSEGDVGFGESRLSLALRRVRTGAFNRERGHEGWPVLPQLVGVAWAVHTIASRVMIV